MDGEAGGAAAGRETGPVEEGGVVAAGCGALVPVTDGGDPADAGRVTTGLPSTAGAPTAFARARVDRELGPALCALSEIGAGDFRVIVEGSTGSGVRAPEAWTSWIAGAAAITAKTRVIVHLVRMQQFWQVLLSGP
jgi:hypothetical protein